jgi:hypothetical protein
MHREMNAPFDSDQPTKECPSCKSQVHADAKVCRNCRHRFGAARGAVIGAGVVAVFVVGIIAATGKHMAVADAGSKSTSAPTPLLGKYDSSLPPFVRRVYALEDECRGGINITPASPVCRQRDAAVEQLQKMHWCNGEPGQTDADSIWHECVALENAPISKQHREWIETCQDAIRNEANDPRSADFPDPGLDVGAFSHLQADELDGPVGDGASPAVAEAWLDKHPDQFSETISFKFHAKNAMGGVQRYTAFCTFRDNFDGTTKLVSHAAGAD